MIVGFSRRNFLVPVPRLKDISELNKFLRVKCEGYQQHLIKGREGDMGFRLRQEPYYFYSLPKYRFDTSKTSIAKASEFSIVRFDKNNYSVPATLIGKETTIKAYGNHIEIYNRAELVVSYDRIYGRGGETIYTLEHYMPLLERKPRSVFNAKPVRQFIQKDLLEWGMSFPNANRDTVKLLRLCLDYGTDSIISIRNQIPHTVNPTIDLVRSYLNGPVENSTLPIDMDIPVDTVDLSAYDQKFGMAVNN